MNLFKAQWTRFPGRPHGRYRSSDIRVTIDPHHVIYLNERAWEALGRAVAVEMMFDKVRRVIALVPSDLSVPEAFPLKDHKAGRGRKINAAAFCSHFCLKMMRTGHFNEVDVDSDGIMTLSLSTISAISRGAR